VWAYCRELCGPTAGDRAEAAILSTLAEGSHPVGADELLLITRETAAQFAFAGMNGSRDKLKARFADECTATPARLADRAGDALTPTEEDELAEHLKDCLPCNAVRIKMDRAERGFATLWDHAPTIERPAGAPADAADGAEATADAHAPAADATLGDAELDPSRAKAAMRAYCRELCGPVASTRAVVESLAAVGMGSVSSIVREDELLRMTRLASAKHVSVGVRARAGECSENPARLAALANGELDAAEQRELERHLEECLRCQAIEIKLDRAERAFSVMAGVAGEIDPHSGPPPGPGRPSATPRTNGTRAPVEAAPAATSLAPRPRASSRRGLVAAAGALSAGAALAAVLLLSGGSRPTSVSRTHRAAAVAITPAPVTASLPAPVAASRRAAKAKPATHRAPARARRGAKGHRTTAAKRVTRVTPAATPIAPSVVVPPEPSPVLAPVTSPPASPSPPARTPSVTPQGSSLPAQSAPTQGIGSGG
jgi:hypothetical protein